MVDLFELMQTKRSHGTHLNRQERVLVVLLEASDKLILREDCIVSKLSPQTNPVTATVKNDP